MDGNKIKVRVTTSDMDNHIAIRTYFGNASLEDFVEACITAAKNAGKPAVFHDEMGVETWFLPDSRVAERTQYMERQRAAQIAAIPVWRRVLRWVR